MDTATHVVDILWGVQQWWCITSNPCIHDESTSILVHPTQDGICLGLNTNTRVKVCRSGSKSTSILNSTLDEVWLSTSCSSSTKGTRSIHRLRTENTMQGSLAITLLTAPSNLQLKVTVHPHTCPLFYMTHHLCIIWECNSCPRSSVFCFDSEVNFILHVKVLPLCIIFTVVLLRITVSRRPPVTTTDTGICHCWCLWLTNWLFCENAK